MLVEMIGCPASGKTTVASRLFSNIKNAGFNSEYITEQARLHIAQLRVDKHLKPNDPLVLTDEDQLKILTKQLNVIQLMTKACGSNSLIITDTSPLNSLLYMTEDFKNSEQVQSLIKEYKTLETLTFYCKPVEWTGSLDPNRVHSKEQSAIIDSQIPDLIIKYVKNQPITLIGDPDLRARTATSEVFQAIVDRPYDNPSK